MYQFFDGSDGLVAFSHSLTVWDFGVGDHQFESNVTVYVVGVGSSCLFLKQRMFLPL